MAFQFQRLELVRVSHHCHSMVDYKPQVAYHLLLRLTHTPASHSQTYHHRSYTLFDGKGETKPCFLGQPCVDEFDVVKQERSVPVRQEPLAKTLPKNLTRIFSWKYF